MSQSNPVVFEITKKKGLYIVRCSKCGYVAVSMLERLAIDLMREHLKNTHNIKI
jgi:uncharacterized Zn finger protein